MAKADVSAKDRDRYARARARGEARAHDPSAVVEARYDPDRDRIDLKFAGGGSMAIPRSALPELQRASAASLESIVVSLAGDAVSWPSLDVDVYVPGLVERVFGTRLFAAATGRRGGRRRSKAKAATSKANGAKGGRPRKRVSAWRPTLVGLDVINRMSLHIIDSGQWVDSTPRRIAEAVRIAGSSPAD